MKRIKIMLMSLLVFAVAGGALSFKVKFMECYCTTLARQVGQSFVCTYVNGQNLFCPNPALNRTLTNQGIPVCTTPCPLDKDCQDVRCVKNVTFTTDDL